MEDFQGNRPHSSLSPFSFPNPDPLLIDSELWLMAEQRTQEILYTIQPNIMCDKRRKEVINYLRNLIIGYFGTEVLAFGSVPLKTYLPDGDIDLTAFCRQDMVEDFGTEVCSLLEREEDSEFHVRDVQYIHAQVKVVKCTVKDIPVDISFNQMAGLCTLCFLEQVDQLTGKEHLFKRSIVLIKAWCYYESRILGSHHGLLSTYALETLVLYLVNLFHVTLRGPLEVLYKFLEYYGKFDWANYCMTINGPVALSSLAEVTAEGAEFVGVHLLLSLEFLRNSRDMYSLPIRAHEPEVQEFIVKHLNILDPLNNKNNLGRSVGKGNFHRIISAFSYGSKKLAKILLLPGVSLGEKLEKFFVNTLERNGRGERPDAVVPFPLFGTGKCEPFDLTGDYDSYYGGLQYTQMYHKYAFAASMQPSLPYPSVWDENTLAWTVQSHESGFYQGGVDVFYPTVPFYDANSLQLLDPTLGISKFVRSRGTGTYIPEMTHDLYKDVFDKKVDASDKKADVSDKKAKKKKNPEKKNPEPTQGGIWMKSAQNCGQVDNPTGKDRGILEKDSGPPNFSLDEFPLLQITIKSNLPAVSETMELSPKSMQVKQSTTTFGRIEFATSKQSLCPSGVSSGSASEQANPVTSNPLDSAPYAAAVMMAVQKKEELVETRQEAPQETRQERIPKQLYELQDDKDFPPLS